jgi:hypothetical protein
MMMTCGIGWADDHHDVPVVDAEGLVIHEPRIGNDAAGVAELWELLADVGETAEVLTPVAIETPEGLLVVSGRPLFDQPRWSPLAIETATPQAERSPTPPMPSCWQVSCGPTGVHRPARRTPTACGLGRY